MMHIPQLVAAFLAVRQSEPLLPSTYCTPECPSCKTEAASFDSNVSCVANSSFITNCGTCQQCIITYAIEEGATDDTTQLENDMITILNLCENSTASTQIQALQSQASKLSMIGVYLSSVSAAEAASKMAVTSAPGAMVTGSASTTAYPDDWTSWTTRTWTDGTASATPLPNNTGIFSTTTPSPIIPSYPAIATPTPVPTLSSVWIAGPVMGSILGVSTVFIVIFLTRRKHNRSLALRLASILPKDIHSDTDSNRSSTQPPVLEISIPPEELEVHEVHELPALEPAGSELNTPQDAVFRDRDGSDGGGSETWPLPLGPLPLLFAMSELRDQRAELNNSPRHETFYHA